MKLAVQQVHRSERSHASVAPPVNASREDGMIEAASDGRTFVTSGNRWDLLPVPPIGAFEGQLSVSVVIPNRDEPLLAEVVELLADQSYPDDLVEIIVVDDGSQQPLDPTALSARAAGRVQVIENPSSGFGAGAARRAGAAVAQHDVLVFVDADLRVPCGFLEAHARWHHVAGNAVVVGEVRMLEGDAVATERLRQEPDVAYRPVAWVSRFLDKTHQLRDDHRDIWSVTAGANLSVSRSFYEVCGGFAGLGIRGVEDIEFGYRAYAYGGLIVPEPAGFGWHPPERFFDDPARGAAAKQRRAELLADRVPTVKTRPASGQRIRSVPGAVVHVRVPPSRNADASVLLEEIDGFLESARPTTELVLHGLGESSVLPVIMDGVAADPRVRLSEHRRPESSLAPQVAFCELEDLRLVRRMLIEQRSSRGLLGATHADRGPTVVLPGRVLHRALGAVGSPDHAWPDSEVLLLAQKLFGGDWTDVSISGDRLQVRTHSTRSPADRDGASEMRTRVEELEAQLDRVREENRRLRSRRVVRFANRLGALRSRVRRSVDAGT
jgi:GT2 family glycosyltransferase